MAVIFLPPMLQKPAPKSKTSDHNKYLKKRLALWKDGKLKELLSEGAEIQKWLTSSKKKAEATAKGFTRLMMEGKVREALKLINAAADVCGVHTLSDEVKRTLKQKHPDAETPKEEVLAEGDVPRVETVLFERIDSNVVQQAAKKLSGSGGPTKITADTWKYLLCGAGLQSNELTEQVAVMARRLCTEDIEFEYLDLLWSCRLIPLMKEDSGVRPIGIGETLRRIIGKSVLKVLGKDIKEAAGLLQTCAGVESGIETAIHGMSRTFQDDQCEAVLLVDADNAFNRLNRNVALHNIQRLCPSISQFLLNSYKAPAKLHFSDGTHILSEEGVTQGDPLAMAKYALATRNLIVRLKEEVPDVCQFWFADDSVGGGLLVEVKKCSDLLNQIGPVYGCYPKPSKAFLILKDPQLLQTAEELFGPDGVQVTVEGKRHIGAVIGTNAFKEKYVNDKIEGCVKDVKQLADIANEEPQVPLCAFNTGLSQRWKFIQRTVQNTYWPLVSALRGCDKGKFDTSNMWPPSI